MSLACTPPDESERALVRWSVRDLAEQLVSDGCIESIHYSTVCLILQEFEVKPHRTRYWLNVQDPDFERKAASVLWYYERAETLAQQGVLVVCTDEKTGLQALSRKHLDLQPAPGLVRRREFEYRRHGIVNLSLANVVTTGELHGYVLPGNNNSDNFIESLERLDHGLKGARRIELILDNASSHTSAQTTEWFERHADRFRPHFTPKHASWLNQAELAISAFTRRYTRHAVVKNRDGLVDRIEAGLGEYNQRYAHPFKWSFTRHAMHQWYERHCQRTSSTRN